MRGQEHKIEEFYALFIEIETKNHMPLLTITVIQLHRQLYKQWERCVWSTYVVWISYLLTGSEIFGVHWQGKNFFLSKTIPKMH